MASVVWSFLNRVYRKPFRIQTPVEEDQSEQENRIVTFPSLFASRGSTKISSASDGCIDVYRRRKPTSFPKENAQHTRTVLYTSFLTICDNSVTRYMRTFDIRHHVLVPVPKKMRENGQKPKLSPKFSDVNTSLKWSEKNRRIPSGQIIMEKNAFGSHWRSQDVASLTEQTLSSLYDPFEIVKKELVKQSRDILLCRYMGNHYAFLEGFLRPAAELLYKFKAKVGWPLCHGNSVVVHLGEINVHWLKTGDFYICVHETEHKNLALSLQYKTETHLGRLSIHEPDFAMDWLSDKQLTSVLRHLLVSVEQGIERLLWNPAEKPWHCSQINQVVDTGVQTSQGDDYSIFENDRKNRNLVAPLARPEEFTIESDVPQSNFQNGHGPTWNSYNTVDDYGYCDNTEYPTSSLSDVDQEVLHSRLVVLPGCRDVSGKSVVVLFCSKLNSFTQTISLQLAQLLMYYYGIPKREDVANGMLILVDGREATDFHWTILDDSFSVLETNIPGSINRVLIWKAGPKQKQLFPNSKIKYELIKEDNLEKYVRKDQLLSEFGGSYVYDHFEWISFFKFFEPFLNGCRFSGHYLVTMMQELGMNLSPSSLTGRLIDQQKHHINQTFQDEQLRHLEEEGDTMLTELESYRKRSPNNIDYRDNLERSSSLYQEVKRTMGKVTKLADKRLKRLEEFLNYRNFHEEYTQVLTWLCRKGEEMMNQYRKITDSLTAVQDREEEFDQFYFCAMRQIDRGNDLLEEATVMAKRTPTSNWKDSGGVEDLAVSLKQHLDNFTERLEDTRERFEETAKCYHLLDKCYEWALETMKYVSAMKMDTFSTPDYLAKLIKNLQNYVNSHPPISEETFEEMITIAKHLGNNRLLEQCKTAQSRCQVTTDLVKTRQHMLLKAKEHLEQEIVQQKVKEIPTCKYRHRTCSQNLWSSQPLQSLAGSQIYQRHSIATGSPFGLYLPFSNGHYPGFKQDIELNWYLQQKEEQFLNQGLITEDLTTQGPVASIPTSVLEARVGQHGITPTNIKYYREFEDKTNNNSIQETSHYNPIKRHSHPKHTWKFCEEALDKVTAEVRVQNERLQMKKRFEKEGENTKSILVETEETPDYSVQYHSSPVFSPVPVNSHLTRPTSLDLSEVSIHEDKGKSKKTLMLIMREMIQTERDYVKSLEYIIENYVPELLREDIPQALRGQRNAVFGNIEKIYEFHNQYFLNEIELCEGHPFSVGQCFLKYESQFYLYALYNKNKPKSDNLMSEYGTVFFREKQLELCDKMDLASYLLKPVQRMGKYALLLKQLLKECPERNSEYQELKAAEEMVRFQLRHGNDLLAMDALRECDINVKEQGRLLRQEEFLVWQGRSRKSLRHLFLFDDLILFSKARRNPERKGFDIYQYKHSIKTTDIGLTEQVGESPTKFEIWFRKRKMQDTYILQAPNAEIKHAWVQEISKLLWKQALRNREMRLAEMSSMGIGRKPCLDIRPNEDQINDRFINLHQLNRASCFRNSIGCSPFEHVHNNKRPHSIISISSSSSSGSSQSSFSLCTSLNLGLESNDNIHSRYRSVTQHSQCSTESGFCTDSSLIGDVNTDMEHTNNTSKPEHSVNLISQESLNLATPSFPFSHHEEENSESVTTPM